MTLTRRHALGAFTLAGAPSLLSSSAFADTCAVPPRQDLPGPARLIANENPYGPSPKARDAMFQAFDEAHRYAMRAAIELKAQIAAGENVDKSQVFLGAGSGEILRMAGLRTALDGKKILAATPTFEMLQPYAEQAGAEIVRVALDANYVHDLDALADAITDDIGLVYICNPNNPTGTLLPADDLRAFCKQYAPQTLIMIDEAYIELTDDPVGNSMIDLVQADANVLITRTFSKLHGMAGLRIGWGMAPAPVVQSMSKLAMAMPNTLGLRAAIASYADTAFQAFSKERIITGRQMVMDVCGEVGLAYAPSHTNFVFFDAGMPAGEMSAKMRERNIMFRGVQGFETHCRVSVGTVEHMAMFQEALRSIVTEG